MTTPTILRVAGKAWLPIRERAFAQSGPEASLNVWDSYPLAVDGEGEPVRCDVCGGGGLCCVECGGPWAGDDLCECSTDFGDALKPCPSPLCLHGWERKLCENNSIDDHGCDRGAEPPIRMTVDKALNVADHWIDLGVANDIVFAAAPTKEDLDLWADAMLARHILKELRKQVTP